MTTVPHEPVGVGQETRRWSSRVLVPEMWAFLAIAVIWLSVLLDAIYGPEIVTRSAGGDFVSVPSTVVVAFFAFLATWVVARHGFSRERTE